MLINNILPFDNHKKGFIPIHRVWPGAPGNIEVRPAENYPQKINALYRFIESCQGNDIRLHVCVSPHYVTNKGLSRYQDISEQLFNLYGIKVKNFESGSTFLNHPEYFVNPFHLNWKGAQYYTQKIAETDLYSEGVVK